MRELKLYDTHTVQLSGIHDFSDGQAVFAASAKDAIEAMVVIRVGGQVFRTSRDVSFHPMNSNQSETWHERLNSTTHLLVLVHDHLSDHLNNNYFVSPKPTFTNNFLASGMTPYSS